mmetsp:Transcript_54313/g.151211  ORF Transcript_54313/g.151211 Transcript_54313/m.151211 type:complete len:284 (+) Transcript_54313:373-1224(+)
MAGPSPELLVEETHGLRPAVRKAHKSETIAEPLHCLRGIELLGRVQEALAKKPARLQPATSLQEPGKVQLARKIHLVERVVNLTAFDSTWIDDLVLPIGDLVVQWLSKHRHQCPPVHRVDGVAQLLMKVAKSRWITDRLVASVLARPIEDVGVVLQALRSFAHLATIRSKRVHEGGGSLRNMQPSEMAEGLHALHVDVACGNIASPRRGAGRPTQERQPPPGHIPNSQSALAESILNCALRSLPVVGVAPRKDQGHHQCSSICKEQHEEPVACIAGSHALKQA